ncbi:unnamed protein product [Cylicocyclus nassatus]|uniref:U3 small nucleolar RNA-associated protein 15 homolog n=1 Tax=Cylicocyclus nassatus TaxID=53992 RepID=A0AA36GI99_CYLNA|nr:unnamed protein product [Cylicocyclus nassatus]
MLCLHCESDENNLFFFSDGGDDLCYSAKPTMDFTAHKDAIRASAISAPNESLLLTGGYDHKVKLWDCRCVNDGPTVEVDVNFPVESVVFLNNEHLIATAAGPIVRIWDIAAGGRQLMSLQQHHKTVTSLCLAKNGDVLLSGGIDRRVNAFRLIDFTLLHSMSMAAPVLSLAISPDDQTMAVGIGQLLAIHRRAPESKAMVSAQVADNRTMVRTAAPKVRVQEAGKPRETKEISAKSSDQHRLSKIDTLLKGYQHSAAIRKMFHSYYFHTKKEEVVAWLRIIIHRGAIRRAISGQENDVLVNMLKFVHVQMFRGSHFDVLRHVVDAFFEVYANEELHPKVAKLALSLKTAVAKELIVQNQLSQTIGALESIMNAARTSTLHYEPPKKRNWWVSLKGEDADFVVTYDGDYVADDRAEDEKTRCGNVSSFAIIALQCAIFFSIDLIDQSVENTIIKNILSTALLGKVATSSKCVIPRWWQKTVTNKGSKFGSNARN